ncbi:hypothetical protein DH2020_044642 [Rehmannia glutinosa]|uniref:Non-specific lipid-transfer protein n=1 Tax=Rehmannia glutinosa TaxID=99300 RepID=A0ABR0UHG5_REHGL
MKGGILTVITIFAIFQLVVQQGQAITCGEVDAALVPCISYLTGHGDGPSPACCGGVKAVKGMAQTTADKRACCGCVKTAANRYADLKDAAAQSLPAKCGVQLDIPISRSVDCDNGVTKANACQLSGLLADEFNAEGPPHLQEQQSCSIAKAMNPKRQVA